MDKGKSSLAFEAVVNSLSELQQSHERELAELRTSHEEEVARLNKEIVSLRAKLDAPSSASKSVDVPERLEGAHPDCDLGLSTKVVNQAATFAAEKRDFIEFVLNATRSTLSKEYRQLYSFLLQCFTDADANFDGRVGFREFEHLITAAAMLPRRFGFAPSNAELYATDWERLKQRMTLFRSLNPLKDKKIDKQSSESEFEYITFSMWFDYAISHVRSKAVGLKDVNPTSQMYLSAEDFKAFVTKACESRDTQEYKEFYHFATHCFCTADTDLDGLIDLRGFDKFIDLAAAAPRRFGFAPPASETYSSEEEKLAARRMLFESLDAAKAGYLDFCTCLEHIYRHMCEKVATLHRRKTSRAPSVKLAAPRSMCGSVSVAT
eukprot:TRINITY_DN17295_c0_g1_i1.p1 TRINITY_DN17295_c0_g1~~TRINITY_DN17295_c0_g1_i1.p1  ORF type:complete len:378 (-),score=55.60 TRINITY_DN17295_c0_g1_i1:269-1402(-)